MRCTDMNQEKSMRAFVSKKRHCIENGGYHENEHQEHMERLHFT
jgi:hypothetical protein